MSQLLTARAVADELGVSAETVLRWTRRGQVPAIRLPSGAIRYRSEALATWLAEHELGKDNGHAADVAEVANLAVAPAGTTHSDTGGAGVITS